jgi:hypothetical protein
VNASVSLNEMRILEWVNRRDVIIFTQQLER